MPRADLLLDLVRAGSRGDQGFFRKALEALIAEERAKQHHILADRLAAHLHAPPTVPSAPGAVPRQTNAVPAADSFLEINPRRTLEQLVLMPGVAKACQELVEEHHRADLLRSQNLEPRHRLLLIGPPGNGKTSLAEALAAELMLPFIVVRYEGVITSFLGETALRLSRLFDHVRSRRCLLFFDEFDVVGKERGDVHDTGEIKRLVSSLLLQVDALPAYVVVVAATNHAELLDRAVWRRFQLRISLLPPTGDQIRQWLERFQGRLEVPLEHSVESLARNLEGLSFAEIEEFGEDVQRRYVLDQPFADMRRIVSERIEQRTERAVPASRREGRTRA